MKRSFWFRVSVLWVLTAVLIAPQNSLASPRKAAHPHGKSLTVKQVAQSVLPSVVRLTVLNKDGVPAVQGSGLVVGDDLIATNLHVVAGGHAVTANFENGRSETVFGVIAVDSEHDLVLLRAFTHGVRSLPLEPSTAVQVGDDVVAVGSPEGLGGSISTGVVSGMRLYGGSKVIQTTAPISHGSSGGGLIDMSGRVIGVTSFFNSDGQNLNFAYPAYFLHQLVLHQLKTVMTWKDIEDYQARTAAAPTPALAPSAPTSEQTVPATDATSRAADTNVFTDKPLAGVKEVVVSIDDIAADAKQDGLNADDIKTAIELRLRRSGIPVLEKFSSDMTKPGVTFDIAVSTVKTDDDTQYLYHISAVVGEDVTIYRPTALMTYAITWTGGEYGIVGKARLTQLNDSVNTIADKFANDFLAQNPAAH